MINELKYIKSLEWKSDCAGEIAEPFPFWRYRIIHFQSDEPNGINGWMVNCGIFAGTYSLGILPANKPYDTREEAEEVAQAHWEGMVQECLTDINLSFKT